MANDRFENVTAIKKANVYFDGKVTSRTSTNSSFKLKSAVVADYCCSYR